MLVKTLFRVLTSLYSLVYSYHAINLTQSYLLPGLLICLKSLSRPLFWASVAPHLHPNLPVQPRLPHSQHSFVPEPWRSCRPPPVHTYRPRCLHAFGHCPHCFKSPPPLPLVVLDKFSLALMGQRLPWGKPSLNFRPHWVSIILFCQSSCALPTWPQNGPSIYPVLSAEPHENRNHLTELRMPQTPHSSSSGMHHGKVWN